MGVMVALAAPPLPPDGARMLSDMGMRRGRTSGEPTYHAGMDLGHRSGRGTPVMAIQKGIVERVLSDDERRIRAFSGYGNGVIVNHKDGTWALYAHLDGTNVNEGDWVQAGDVVGTMGNSSNGKFRGMGTHLHVELRRAKRDGSSPFPGPYRYYNLDPRDWMDELGLRFDRRGNFEIVSGGAVARSRPSWSGRGAMAGADVLDPYPKATVRGYQVPETAMAGLGQASETNAYEPVRFERDVYFGLTPVEWAAAGAGTLVLTGAITAIVLTQGRASPTPNRRHRRRRRRRTSRRR